MYRSCALFLVLFLTAIFMPSCAGNGSPVIPPGQESENPSLTPIHSLESDSGRMLWGLYHITLDPVTGTAEIVPMRTADVGVNVTRFMQPPDSPVNMISLEFDPGASDYANGLFVLDITLHHPFPGVPRFRGFDVRGIFMSDADSNLPGDISLTLAGDNASTILNPDGLTRWWNSTEFTLPSIFGFYPGGMAPPTTPDAILNPYKYFCDDIEAESPLSDVTLENRGTFGITPGVNTRRYEIQFKMEDDHPVFDFNYAIDASWEDIGQGQPSYEVVDFPLAANCNEAWWVEIDTTQSSLYFSEPDVTGGDLVLDVTVHDWQALALDGSVVYEVSDIHLYSEILPVLTDTFTSLGATVINEDYGVATWRVIQNAADLIITGLEDIPIWIGVHSASPNTYAPQFPGGDAWPHSDGPLAAYDRGSVSISGIVPQNAPTVIEIIPDWGLVDEILTDVQVIGTNFIAQGLDVEFSNGMNPIPVSNILLVSDSEITLDLDLTAADIGFYDVTVVVDDLIGPGTLDGVLEDGFEVVSPAECAIIEVIPSWGYQGNIINDVQILGSGFIEAGLDVEFTNGSYSIPVSNLTWVSDTEITLDIDLTSAELGFYDVIVTTDDFICNLENGFQVLEVTDEFGWPLLNRDQHRRSYAPVVGPQAASEVYSESCTQATAPETLLIGKDPDNPGDWLVYLGYYASSGADFTAYRASDGSEKWSVSIDSPYSFYRLIAVAPPGVPCPNGESGTVYISAYPPSHAAAERIYALSAHDGSVLWDYTVPGGGSWLHLERMGLVLDSGDLVFCDSSSGYHMTCLNYSDGSEKWKITTNFHQTPDPALSSDENTIYIFANASTTLRAYDLLANPPTQKWYLNLSAYLPAENQSDPIVASDGYIYAIGRTCRLVKISDNGSSGSVVWATPAITGSYSAWAQLAEGPDGSIYAPVPSGGSFYPCSLYRFDPADGSVLNQSPSISGYETRSGLAIGSDGLIYIPARGYVYCYNSDCTQKWVYSVPSSRFTDVALNDDGSLYAADVIGGNLYRFHD